MDQLQQIKISLLLSFQKLKFYEVITEDQSGIQNQRISATASMDLSLSFILSYLLSHPFLKVFQIGLKRL